MGHPKTASVEYVSAADHKVICILGSGESLVFSELQSGVRVVLPESSLWNAYFAVGPAFSIQEAVNEATRIGIPGIGLAGEPGMTGRNPIDFGAGLIWLGIDCSDGTWDLARLKGAHNLRFLRVSNYSADDRGLEELLTACRQLTSLSLTSINSPSLKLGRLVSRLHGLRVLEATDVRAGVDGFRPDSLPDLSVVNLSGTPVPPLDRFKRASKVHWLGLNRLAGDLGGIDDVDDKQVALVSTCKSLRNLSLRGSQITTKGLEALLALPLLAELDLRNCSGLSEEDIGVFLRRHPACRVIR